MRQWITQRWSQRDLTWTWLRTSRALRWVGITLAAAAILTFVIVMLFFMPGWQVSDEITDPLQRDQRVNDARRTNAQIVAGVVVLFGATITGYLTLRRVAAVEETVKVAQQGQITERFTRAVDQLGATASDGKPRLELRLGGIYSLRRIAEESQRDYWPVMDLLAAYLRMQFPAADSSEDSAEIARTSSAAGAADGLAIITILREALPPELRPDGLDLSKGDLLFADLEGADLSRANLSRANLGYTTLTRADLTVADLTGANLRDADLTGAHLTGADLTDARLAGANLRDADLTGAHLTGADLTDARLAGANLTDANFMGAYLLGADFSGADLSRANLGYTKLTDAKLGGAKLGGAKFGDADLREADLTGADFTGADITGATMPDGWEPSAEDAQASD